MNNYDEFSIVEEDMYRMSLLKTFHNTHWHISCTKNNDVNDEAPFTKSVVECTGIISKDGKCHAEVIFTNNNGIAEKVRQEFAIGDSLECNQKHGWIVIRILEKKSKLLEQFEERRTRDVTFVVDGEKCEADRHYLAAISPVFKKMLFGDFAEAKQNEINLKEEESAKIFNDFLLAVSPLRIKPNPTNVVGLLKLADHFDIPFLIRDCENHLKHCYEIPVVDRLTLANTYNLNGAKMLIGTSLSKKSMVKLWNTNRAELSNLGLDFFFGHAMSGIF